MALTHDYLDFLDAEVEISPANSQEELQAAEVIRDLMAQHGVDATIEEFSAPRLGGLYGAIVACAMFVGVVLSGVGVLPLALLGLVLAVVPTVLLGLSLTGRHFDPAFGPAVRSQNVVAVHRACGSRATHQNHPVVVCAHYDSPHENFLRANGVAQYVPAVAKAAKCCVPAVAVCALLQLLAFIPAPVRLVLWLVGIVAAVPALVMAVAAIAERMMPCTVGANDNKASVAALLGVVGRGRGRRERPARPGRARVRARAARPALRGGRRRPPRRGRPALPGHAARDLPDRVRGPAAGRGPRRDRRCAGPGAGCGPRRRRWRRGR